MVSPGSWTLELEDGTNGEELKERQNQMKNGIGNEKRNNILN